MVRNTDSLAIPGAAQRKVKRSGPYRTRTALAGGLAATILLALPATAQTTYGGRGGQGNAPGSPAGGASNGTGAGGTGSTAGENYEGAGGGGAGATGGAGGAAWNGTPGGAGGATAGASGDNGTGGGIGSRASGGGGGAHGAVLSGAPGVAVTGGHGGNGGSSADGDGGGGGAGGYGAVTTGTGTIFFNYAITGGNGGNGGAGYFYGGSGGDGGIGLLLTGTGTTVSISGAVNGGNGGNAGAFVGPGFGNGDNGAGGIGLVASDVNIVLHATIRGGVSGNGVTRALAMRLGGANQIALASGWGVVGGIELAGGSLEFVQGNNQSLANEILGTGKLIKSSIGTLTLTGANSYSGGTEIRGGTLVQGSANALGSGNIALNGGTLNLFAYDLALSRISGTGSITSSAGGKLTQTSGSGIFGSDTGTITSSAGIFVGTGATLTLLGNNDLTGGITVSGTLRIGASGAAGTNNTITTTGSVISYANGVDNGAAIQIASNTTQLEVLAANVATQSGAIGEDQPGRGFEKIGTGRLILTGASSYTGTTTLTAGSLQIGNGGTSGTLGSGQASLAAGTELVFNRSDTIAAASQITGDGQLRKLGGGQLTLNGASSYTGGTIVEAGTLGLGHVTAAGTGTIWLRDGTTLRNTTTGSTVFFDNAIRIDAGETATINGNTIGGAALNGAITGGGDLIFTGLVALTGTSGYGTTTVNSNSELLAGYQTRGTLGTGNVTNYGLLTFGRTDTVTVSNVISGTGDVRKRNGGVVILTGDNDYTGITTINVGGTIQVGDGGTTGTLGTGDVTNSGTLIFNRGDDITVANNISGSTGHLTQQGAGMLTLTGSNSYGAGTTISAGILRVGDGGNTGTLGSGSVTNDSALVFNRSDDIAVANAISGSGSLTKLGGGVLTLSGNNGYDGGTTISAGTLKLGSATAHGTGSILLDGGTLDVGDLAFRLAHLSGGNGTITASGTGSLSVGAGEAVTFGSTGNSIDSDVMLTIAPTGALTLLGNNGLTGGITLAGRLVIGESGAAGGVDNTIFTIGSVISYADGVDNGTAIVLGSDTTQLEVLGTDIATQSGTISQDLQTRGFEKTGTGTLILTAANNSYTGATTVSAGTLGLGNDSAAGTGALNLADNTTLLNVSCGCAALTLTNAIQIALGGTATIDSDGYETVLAGNITGGNLVFADTFGGGTTYLTGANSYGDTRVGTGATLMVGDGGTTGSLGTGAITVDALAMLAFNRSDVVTLSSAVTGDGFLGQFGTGTLILTADNSYTGGTVLLDPAGTLQVGDGGTTGSLGNGPVFMAGGTLVFNRSNDINFAGSIAGDGRITKLGAGTLTLSGDNLNGASGPYVGAFSIQAGTLAIGEFGLGASQLVEIDNGATLKAFEDSYAGDVAILSGGGTIDTDNYTLEMIGALDLQGELTKTGTGTLLLGDVNEEGRGAGGINVTAGTLGLGSDFAAGTGLIKLANGTTLLNAACGCARLDIDNNIQVVLGGVATFDGGGNNTDLNGAISGGDVHFATSLSAPFAGSIFRLNGANSYGATRIGPNVALIVYDGKLGTGDVTFDAAASDPTTPAALVFQNATDYSFAGRIIGSGIVSVESDPRYSVTLTGSNTATDNFTGSVDVISGRLVINGSFGDVVGNTTRMTLNGGALGGSGTFHGSVALDNTTLSPGNSPGTLNIAGNLTLGAGTILNFELGAPGVVGGASNDLVNVGGNLTLDGTLNAIAWGAGYGPGYYRLFNYGGTLTDNGLTIGTVAGGLSTQILTNIDGQVNLRLGGSQAILYWDGADMGTTAGIAGGAGTWNGTNTNWTGPTGFAINDAWQSQVGVFAGAAGGTVTVDGTQNFEELRFETNGYVLRPADGSARLNTTGGFSIIDVSSGVTADIGVIIQGGAGLDKTGTGTLILSAVNSYSGATDVAAGTLRLGINNALTDPTALTVQAGATFDLNGFQTHIGSLAGAGTVTLNNGRLDTGYNNTSTIFSGTVTGADGGASVFTKNGSGTLALNGTIALGNGGGVLNSFAQINAGTLQIAGTGRLNADLIQNFSTIENSGTIEGFSNFQTFGTVTNNATGVINGNTQNFSTFDNYGTMGGLQSLGGIATNYSTGVINGNVQTFASFISTGIINGSISNFAAALIEKQVNGEIGNFQVGASVTLTGTVTGITNYQGVQGALLDLAGFDTTVGALNGSGAIQLGVATLTVDSSRPSSSFNGTISGSGGLIKTGSGEQILGGLNDYTGATAVNAGTLSLDFGGALTSDVTVANGASFINSGTLTGLTTNGGTLTGSGAFNGALALVNLSGGTATLGGQANGAVQNSGTFNASGVTGITGFSQVAGGQLNLIADLALGSLSGAGGVNLDIYTLAVGASGANTSFDGAIAGNGGLTKTGAGVFTLTGTNSYNGATLVNGGTLQLASTGTIAGEVVNNAALVSMGTLNGGLTNNGIAMLGNVVNGLIQNQSGTISLTSDVTGTGQFNQSSGALFDLALRNASFGSLSGEGTVDLRSGRLAIGSDDTNTSFAGTITGIGGITKTGDGAMTLTGVSTYGGTTFINQGTLSLGDGGAIGGGLVANNGTLDFGGSIDRGFGNTINGSGSLTKNGTGLLILTGANGYNGGTQVLGGVVGFDNGQALGNGDIGLANGTGLRNVQAGAVTLANSVHVSAGTATLEGVNGSSTTLTGPISGGDVRFTVAGAGTASFTLDSVNSYRDTQIGAGATVKLAGGTLGTGNVALTDASASLTFATASNYSYGGVISGNGQIGVNTAAGTGVTLTASNDVTQNFTGTVTVNSGQLTLNGAFGDVVSNTASLTLNGGSLGGRGTFYGDVTVTSGTLSPGNSPGTLNIGGNLNLGAGTILNFELGEAGTPGGANNDLVNVGGNLTLDGTLNVVSLPGFGEGYYRLFNYGGTLTDNGLLFGAMPAGYTSSLRTNIGGQVNILFASSPQAIQYWDGTDLTGGTAGAGGGAGTWSSAGTNWTAPTGYAVNDSWRGQVAVFGGAAGGNVTVAGVQAFQELRFQTGGYVIAGATAADGLATTGGFSVIDVSSGVDTTINAVISGMGGLTKTGTGTLTLGGANSYAGVTTVSGGTLALAASGSLAGAVQNDATFTNAGTVAGLVASTGTLTSTGTLAGGLNNSGAASLAGTVTGAIANSGGISLTGTTTGIGAVTQVAGGSIALNGFSTSFGSLAGAGAVNLGSAALTLGGDNASTSFSGIVSGSGGLTKAGTGTFTLTGTNSYTGTTTVSAGTLQLSGTGTIAGAVLNNATFTNVGTVAGLVTNNATLSSTGTLSGGLANSGAATLSGTLTGAVSNSGTITLAGTTTGIGAVTQAAGGSIALNGFDTRFGSLAGTGAISNGGGTLAVGDNNGPTSFAGVISGSGALIKAGTGTFTLTGANTYTGLTTVGAGTLALGTTGSLAGNVLNQASFANAGAVAGMVQNDGTLTSSGTISGGLLNNGNATLSGTIDTGIVNNGSITLNGATTAAALQQAATGSFNLAGSSASVGTLTGSGAITLGSGVLTIGAGNGNSSFAGTISGSGSLTKAGTGGLVLTGTASQTGGTTISAGTLQIGNGGTSGSIAGAIVNNGLLVLNRGDVVTLANAISGTGGFVQAGTGTTTLTGANSYTGGTLVSAGRLRGDTASLKGDIRIDATLEFAQAANGSYAGRLIGAGLFEKSGIGILSLTGDSSSFTGATRVLSGALAVNGLLSRSIVTIGNGATLGGTGTVGGIIAQSGATVAPGNSVGTLNVSGNVLFQAGSLFAAEVQPSGSDKILATGTAQLGGTLALLNLGGTYAFNSVFVLLRADSGVTGTFNVTGLNSFGIIFRPKIIYTASEVQLMLAPNRLTDVLGNLPLSYNQTSTISRIDAAVVAGYDPTPIAGLYNLAPAAIPAALDQLSGEVYASATRAVLEDERSVREAALGRLGAAADVGLSGTGGWGQMLGSWGSANGDGNAAGYDVDRTGFMMGVDTGAATEEGSWRAGLMGHHARITVPVDARASRAEIDRSGAGVYFGLDLKGWRINAGASYSWLDLDAKRQVNVAGIADSLRGKSKGKMIQAFGEIAYRIDAGGQGFIAPYLAGSITRVEFDVFKEVGGPAALVARDQKSVFGIAEFGLRGEGALGRGVRLGGNVGLRHAMGDRAAEPVLALAAAPSQAFAVRSAEMDSFAVVTNLDLTADISDSLSLRFGYTGVRGSAAREHGARATISFKF